MNRLTCLAGLLTIHLGIAAGPLPAWAQEAGKGKSNEKPAPQQTPSQEKEKEPQQGKPQNTDPAAEIVRAARAQIGKTVRYDPAYEVLKYPGGDVPLERGVCSDVVIRALRTACGVDLQKEVHEDMAANFSAYPKEWSLKRTDKNIDHRRVLNLRVYLKRKGFAVPAAEPADYRPGDLITCTVAKTLPHIMIVSDTKGPDGEWLIIHNIGGGAQEENCLLSFPITGHYRWKAPRPSPPGAASPAGTGAAKRGKAQ